MKYCSHCAAPIQRMTPAGDLRARDTCAQCGSIFYENPKMVVGAILEWEQRILLCRRAIEPRSGLWTLPAGFLENGETTEEGAARETLEESGAQGKLEHLYSMFDIPAINQVHLFFRGRLDTNHLDPGPETLEAGFFTEAEIPWQKLAFTSVRMTLEHYFADRRQGHFSSAGASPARVHTFTLDLSAPPQSSRR